MTSPVPLITCTPGVRSCKDCVAGTRITVSDVLGVLRHATQANLSISD